MHSDSFFTIGSTHRVCQDYAMSGRTRWGKSFAILSDGCSGSPNTDFGSRFLTRAAYWALNQFNNSFPSGSLHITASAFASQMASSCNIEFECLDATLLMAVEGTSGEKEGVWALVFGDGVVAARHRHSHKITLYAIEFPHGYPAYVSYLLDLERLKGYVKHTQGQPALLHHYREGLAEAPSPLPFFDLSSKEWSIPFTCFFPSDEYDVMALFSDGIESFNCAEKDAQTELGLADLVGEFLSFKGHAGEFVVRRAKKAISKLKELGYSHTDDFSMAAIHMG